MHEVEKILESLSLPLALPEAFFELSDGPDPITIVNELPQELRGLMDLDVTASHKKRDGQIVYRLPLINGECLKIRVQNHSIVEIIIADFY
jgi:hypothetical protein